MYAIRSYYDGQIITGMRDNAVWGIYTANFVFFMGLSYAGALVSCASQLLRIRWIKPLVRMADRITSYNVCYTKLLRLLESKHRHFGCTSKDSRQVMGQRALSA